MPREIPIPPTFPVPRLEQRSNCSACASRNLYVKPATCWPHIDPGADLLASSFSEGGELRRRQERACELMEA